MACWRSNEPRKHLKVLTIARLELLPSPERDKVGYFNHDRFRANTPFTFVPAYNLPVYASQGPLPDTTQDSVRGCRLGSTAVAIPGDMVSCAFKAQPAQIRAGDAST